MPTLAELRAKLLEKENKNQRTSSDNAIYAFWNIPFDSTAVIRFLPDGNQSNDFFWVERQMIRLTFPGIVGQNTNKEITIQVPCVEMWGETCPILTEVRPWFKDGSLEDLARKYWKKRSYIFQGFVRDNPMTEDDAPENPIRRFVINPSVYDVVKAALMDPEMTEMPTDFVGGRDFRLIKTKQGDYPNYKTSSYSFSTSSLTEQELEAIEKYELNNLADYLPKKPGEKELRVIAEMFEASVNGELYDPAKWADCYKPFGLEYKGASNGSNADVTSKLQPSTEAVTDSTPQLATVEAVSAPVVETHPEEVATVVEEPIPVVATVTEGEVKKSPADILADIKARASANK